MSGEHHARHRAGGALALLRQRVRPQTRGGAVQLSARVSVDTQKMPAQLAGYAAVILPGFFAENATDLIEQLRTTWQPVIARLRTLPAETLVIFGGVEYGAGSSRDWAAKGTALLGVKAVIAESFERIHR